jgi:Protein of unknown function (DUF3761)
MSVALWDVVNPGDVDQRGIGMSRVAIGLALHVLLSSAAFAQEPGCLQSDEGKLTTHNCYLNSDHQPTHRPSASVDDVMPAGASAKCADGKYSFSRHRSGTCSSHGGVAQSYR